MARALACWHFYFGLITGGIMKKTKENDNDKKPSLQPKKGPVIPAGTEQETGLTRGQTEKPGFKKRNKKI
jgi:hypothetical protein